jgi:hypothetical protein
LRGKRSKILFYTVLLMAGVVGAVRVYGAAGERPLTPVGDEWNWFAAISSVNDWFVLRGVAKVKVSGTSLHAELFDSRDNELAIRITGTIKDGRVDAVAVRLATQDKPRKVTGFYRRTRWKESPGGRDSMLLSEPGEPAGLTVGLTRELK